MVLEVAFFHSRFILVGLGVDCRIVTSLLLTMIIAEKYCSNVKVIKNVALYVYTASNKLGYSYINRNG